MLDFIQQLVSGIALGCVYGLIALGFVLIYKATEVVNFAQGDLMMLGGFFAYTYISLLGFGYWSGFALAVLTSGLLGMLIERLLVRPILGYPPFAIVMATIGLGYFLRSAAGMIWGTDDLKIDNPFAAGVVRIGDLVKVDSKWYSKQAIAQWTKAQEREKEMAKAAAAPAGTSDPAAAK